MNVVKAFLEINRLAVDFDTRAGNVRAVNNVSLSLNKGDRVAIVGESGSGKSVTAYALLSLLGNNGKISAGSIYFDGMALHKASNSLLKDIRGREISMIFQNPMSALNPIRKVGEQISDMLRQHAQATKTTAPKKVRELLGQVEIKDLERVMHAYPFELSGGMCQRVMIALALACNSRLLIADEPTTGLDVTTQKAIMDLIEQLSIRENLSVILITHDLGVASQYCNKFVVMEKGRVVESSDDHSLFSSPQHPYTRKLLAATPNLGSRLEQLTPELPYDWIDECPEQSQEILLEVKDLVKQYPLKGSKMGKPARFFNAVDGVSFTIYRGECVGLVGESGCGKSSTSKMIARLDSVSGGEIIFAGEDIANMSDKQFIAGPYRKQIQMVFQDPTGSLNPRHTVLQLITEPLKRLEKITDKKTLRERALTLCADVGLPEELIDRLPHQLSGGQKARVGIARAIALKPKLLILDEPTSALDVSVQAIVLQLLERLRRKLSLSYLFISHDLNVVNMLSQRVLVMEKGKIVEAGQTKSVMSNPQHAFTKTLIAAIPQIPVNL
jgi:peptide/nickel transport system ATP-binding protein